MWCKKCDRSMGYEDACGYGDYKCSECGTMYWFDKEYDDDGNEVVDDDEWDPQPSPASMGLSRDWKNK